MNHPTRAIAATALLTFSVCLAVIWWQNRSAEPRAMKQTAEPAAAVVEAPAAAPIAGAVRPAPRDESSAPQHLSDQSGPPPIVIPPSNVDGPALPVLLNIYSRRVYTTEEDSEGASHHAWKNVMEAAVTNTSDKPLTVTAIEVNLPTLESSQIQFALAGNGQKHIGTDDGLKMLPGDEITLRSPSFRDFTQQIP